MTDFIIVAILVAVIGLALAHLIRERKKTGKCTGCPEGCHGCHGCHSSTDMR